MFARTTRTRGRAILVTGGTGFVGSAVTRALLAKGPAAQRPEIRVLSRKTLPRWMTASGVVGVRGDLTDAGTLRGIADGAATILHLASQIGGDRERCAAVNAGGTAALMEEAHRAGVRRLVYVSTTSVYGDGVHRGASESLLPPAPVSDTSRSRLAAERLVRKGGGIVLRPHLTYGTGDVWFVPTLLRLLRRVPAWIDGGAAMTSLVAVEDLAEVVAALARLPWEPGRGAVFHVNHPRPASMRTLTKTVCGQLGIPIPEHDLPVTVHRALTKRVLPELSDHQFSLLARDHWYDSTRIWRRVGVRPGPTPICRFARAASWYRKQLGRATVA